MDALNQDTRGNLSPAQSLERLKEGNARFRANKQAERSLLKQVEQTRGGQWPMGVVLTCIDSRTSPEIIFDQGIGDIFGIRIAGNFVNDDILGSMEFACHVAGAKVIMVLGHSHCGAVKGACDGVELGLLTGMLGNFKPALECVHAPTATADRTAANPGFVADVARENVRLTMEAISERSSVLKELIDAGQVVVAGGIYDVESGAIDYI